MRLPGTPAEGTGTLGLYETVVREKPVKVHVSFEIPAQGNRITRKRWGKSGDQGRDAQCERPTGELQEGH
jgi:hypothetical protein